MSRRDGVCFASPPLLQASFSCRGRSQYLFFRLFHAPACISASSSLRLQTAGKRLLSPSFPSVPSHLPPQSPFNSLKFKQTVSFLHLTLPPLLGLKRCYSDQLCFVICCCCSHKMQKTKRANQINHAGFCLLANVPVPGIEEQG